MTYSEFLQILTPYAEEKFAEFQHRLIPTKAKIIGVRTPALRMLAKRFKGDIEEIFSYPDKIYEVTFIKLSIVALMPYNEFCDYIERCLPLIDNWASCDCFKPKCLKTHKEEFLPYLENFFADGREFYQRFVLTVLLSFYMEENYLDIIEDYLSKADTEKYYIHMAAAWLTAELLVKYYERGVVFLKKGTLSPKTHNKAIQKARESYRLSQEQKIYLNSLKK